MKEEKEENSAAVSPHEIKIPFCRWRNKLIKNPARFSFNLSLQVVVF